MSKYILTSDGELYHADYYNEELYHYGVKGMKWGHRKAPEQSSYVKNVKSTKAAYKSAKKDYNKAFNKYYYKSHQALSLSKKKRAANDARFEDAWNKAGTMNEAKAAYKSAKKERKNAIKSTHRELEKNASFGEKFVYNSATRKKAAKYVVDNNMSMADATKKAKGDAWRNTAIFLAAYGVAVGTQLYKNH